MGGLREEAVEGEWRMRVRDGGVETVGGNDNETGSATKKGKQKLMTGIRPASPRTSGIKRRFSFHLFHDFKNELLQLAIHWGKLYHSRIPHKMYHCINVYCIKHLFMHLLYVEAICGFVGIKKFRSDNNSNRNPESPTNWLTHQQILCYLLILCQIIMTLFLIVNCYFIS